MFVEGALKLLGVAAIEFLPIAQVPIAMILLPLPIQALVVAFLVALAPLSEILAIDLLAAPMTFA